MGETRDFNRNIHELKSCLNHLKTIFEQLEDLLPFEKLRRNTDRANYVMLKYSKIIAMTCTHAIIKRKEFIRLEFKYNNIIMEEASQVLEIEAFIPLTISKQRSYRYDLKRIVLVGDHYQLPPVVQNIVLQKYSHLEQSLFERFVKLGAPLAELNAQGRMRPS